MELTELKLPTELCETVREKLIGDSGRSLEEFVAFVLEELVGSGTEELDAAEEKFLADRLRDLGYL